MRGLFKRTVRTAVAMELVDLAVQAVDGTKVAANAWNYSSNNTSTPSRNGFTLPDIGIFPNPDRILSTRRMSP